MKRFGVQLAAVAVVILLGALAAAQAQKDSQSKADSSWATASMPDLDEPPAPIADLGESASRSQSAPDTESTPDTGSAPDPQPTANREAAPPDADPAAGFETAVDHVSQPSENQSSQFQLPGAAESRSESAPPDDSVRLVQHTDPAVAGQPGALKSAPPSLEMMPPAFTDPGSAGEKSKENRPAAENDGEAPGLTVDSPAMPIGRTESALHPAEAKLGAAEGGQTDGENASGSSGTSSTNSGMSMPAGFGFGATAEASSSASSSSASPAATSNSAGGAPEAETTNNEQPTGKSGYVSENEAPELTFGQLPSNNGGAAIQDSDSLPQANVDSAGLPHRPANVLRGGPDPGNGARSPEKSARAESLAPTNPSVGLPEPAANQREDSMTGMREPDQPTIDGSNTYGGNAIPTNALPSGSSMTSRDSAARQSRPVASETRGSDQQMTGGSATLAQSTRVDDGGGPSSGVSPQAAGTAEPDSRLANASRSESFQPGVGQPQGDGQPQGRGHPAPLDQPSSAAPLQPQIDATAATAAAPGDRRLEGAQSPSVVIQKQAPSEVKVGKPASFVIQVQNVGGVEALDVQVHDRIPTGMRLVGASPEPNQQGDRLLWQLGALAVGQERTITIRLVPEQEGELGSVARVSFEAAASVRTVSTRPELKIVQNAPKQVLIGQQLEIELEVSNPGSGEATGVVLQEDVPEGLKHPKGRQLDNLLGALRPGEKRREVLRLRAVTPGVIQNTVRLAGDDGLTAEHTVEVEVIAPELQVDLNGPSRRFLERQATYQISLANNGTADATNVELAAYLDRGFTFVSTGNQGQYDSTRHAVFWSLAELPKGQNGTVDLTLLPVEEGDQAIRMEAHGDLNIQAEAERSVAVDSLAELSFQLADAADPIELGSETTYEIRVHNSGSRNDSNIQVQMQLPAGLELVSSDTEAESDGQGNVFFQPRGELAAGGEVVYQVRVRGASPGTHVAKATITSDQSGVPVTKEESTMVYADR